MTPIQTAIERTNQERGAALARDYQHLGEQLSRRGIQIDEVAAHLEALCVAIPSWGVRSGGTRFGAFPVGGQPRTIEEKLDDIAVLQQLSRACPQVSLHIPWDRPESPAALRAYAGQLGLAFDAMNSNTFEDQPGQPLSYKFGSLCHTDRAVRQQAIEHNKEVIDLGRELGSTAITIWLADGSCFPGQTHLRRSFERTIAALKEIHAHLPPDWLMFTEHKPYEPAFYATVIHDWGSSLLAAQAAGQRARCLVDLGHHLPNCNIEQVVARLIGAGRLGGFHFNDSKYGDDDLTTGSIKPYQLFLVFNELVDAEVAKLPGFAPAYMIDQSHNLKDPLEDLLQSVEAIQKACAKAWLVRRDRLDEAQEANDVVAAERLLHEAYDTDVRPLIAEVRRRQGGAIDTIAAYRAADYRRLVTEQRPQASRTAGSFS